MKITLMFIICCLGWLAPAPLGALTVEEILLLKQNGVSEETIQMMLQNEIQTRSRQNRAAGQTMGIQTITRPNGQPAIVFSTGTGDQAARDAEERLKEERAWEMLRHLIVDTRPTKDRGPRPKD
ncbi:MAG: hypothetical protein V2I40_06075 [Desulfobacteraceae bacterium]|jgi:hypothetical protein|nr:hypothetical protein [Desulfobacteraceae bacterium]